MTNHSAFRCRNCRMTEAAFTSSSCMHYAGLRSYKRLCACENVGNSTHAGVISQHTPTPACILTHTHTGISSKAAYSTPICLPRVIK